jgi:hypothetical protein
VISKKVALVPDTGSIGRIFRRMREPRYEPECPFEIFATSLFKDSFRGLLLSSSPGQREPLLSSQAGLRGG